MFGLAGGGVCRASAVAGTAVRSYRTISPLPVSARGRPSAVYFLWHFPAGCPVSICNISQNGSRPRVAVSHHRALSCSDFPPCTYFESPTISLTLLFLIILALLAEPAMDSQNRCRATARPTLSIDYSLVFATYYKLL